MNFDDLLSTSIATPLPLSEIILNLVIGAFLAFLVRLHFFRYSNSLTNRSEFMTVLPFITLTTVLIISIVKSSLALSLGLVGALSIVRFRTPIKEPEELAYLFISIAIGLGLGANQTLATIISTLIILLLMILFIKNKKSNSGVGETYINISGTIQNTSETNHSKIIFDKILKLSKRTILKRYVIENNTINLTFYVMEMDTNSIDTFVQEMKKDYSDLNITLLDQKNLPPL